MVHFTLYSRAYCHLCDDMLQALRALQVSGSAPAFTVETLDVDADEDLQARFDELVPVLFGKKGGAAPVQLCHYFLDEEKTRAFLSGA